MLSVGDVRYIDFHGIEHLNKLRYLYIENVARLDNLQELENLPSLDTLIINAPIDLHSFSLSNLSKNLKYLALADTSIKSLSGIEQFPFLTTLNLSAYHLRDLGNLEKLTGLKKLTVESKGISNSELKKISRLPLSVLYVYRPESLDFLDSLVNLETLVMELPSEMRDVTIQNNIRLKKLNLTCTYKTHNIKIRKSIKNLHEITLNGFYGIVEFEDPENFHIDSLSIIEAHNESNIFGEIEKLKLLKCLYLKSLRDFSFIRSLTQITKLSIVSPFASLDPNIFKDLHNLKELDLVYRVPASELEKIRKTLPNCKVSAEEIIKGE